MENLNIKFKSTKSHSHLHFERKKSLLTAKTNSFWGPKIRTNFLECKRSQAHIEMIVSFVIFVSFVLAFFIFFAPVRQDKVSYASLDATQRAIQDNSSFSYDYVSVILNATPSGACFSIDNSVDNNLGIAGNVLAKDSNGNLLGTAQDSTSGTGKIYVEAYDDRYYKLYFADFLKPAQLGVGDKSSCQTLVLGSDYSTAVVGTGKDILYDNFKTLNDDYIKNYDQLKNEWGLRNDFEFAVYNFTYGVILNDTLGIHKVKTFPILSRDIPLKAMYKNGSYVDVILNVRVWI